MLKSTKRVLFQSQPRRHNARTLSNFSIILLLITVLLSPIASPPALAQQPTIDEVNIIAKRLNCPTCDTRSLDQCETQTCIQWKGQIRDLMIQGLTEQEIVDWYVARYGDYVLQEPPRRGLGLVAWLLPIIGFLAGATWLGFLMKGWSAKKRALATARANEMPTDEATATETDDYLKRVEQDLQNL